MPGEIGDEEALSQIQDNMSDVFETLDRAGDRPLFTKIKMLALQIAGHVNEGLKPYSRKGRDDAMNPVRGKKIEK